MRPIEYAPSPLLSGLIKCFWTTQRVFKSPQDTFLITPDSYIEVIFSTGVTCFLVTETEQREMPACYLVNLLNKPFTIRAEGTLTLLGIRLYAWSLQSLFQTECSLSAESITALPKNLACLEAGIINYLQQNQPQEAVSYLQQSLSSQFNSIFPLQYRRALLLREIIQDTDSPSLTELTLQFDLSIRQVQRLLKSSSGTTPKTLLRLSRFEQARNRLWQQPKSNLTALAYELGYADQAHFSRDFRTFSQRSPRQFAHQVQLWQNQH